MIDIDRIAAKPQAAIACVIGHAVLLALGAQHEFRFGQRAILYGLSGACLAMILLFIARSYARPGKRITREFIWSAVGLGIFEVLITTSPAFETPVRIAVSALGVACLGFPLFYIWKIWKAKPTDAT